MARQRFEVTSVYISGFKKGLVDLGLLDKVSAKLPAATRAVLDAPFSARSHNGEVLADLSDALREVTTEEQFQEHAYVMARDSLGRILTPMFKVALALTGRTPATLLARVPDSVHQALKGVQVQWRPDGKTGGSLKVDYPNAVNRGAESGWRGTLRFLFELCEGVPASIAKTEWLNGDQTLVIHVVW